MTTSRADWRDAVKDAESLTTNATLIALLIADYWPKVGPPILWCAVSTLKKQSRLSRASVYKFLGELRDKGWLEQVEPGTHDRSPRYRPHVPGSVVQTPSARRTRSRGSVVRTEGVCTDGGVRGTDPKPQVNHSPPQEPSHEKEQRVTARSACSWCGGQTCPQCRPDLYGAA